MTVKLNENFWIWVAAVFAVVSTILVLSWAYDGQLLPDKPEPSASTYDRSGYYVELGLWLLAVVTGLLLGWGVFIRSCRRG